MELKLALQFTDRVGIVADVSAVIAEHGLNIVAMEVRRHHDVADLYLAMDNQANCCPETLFQVLGAIVGCREIRFIEALPQEERENRFQVVLDNISDGVIAVDREGRITVINRVARETLGQASPGKVGPESPAQELIGQEVSRLRLPDYAILECLRGTEFSNARQDVITAAGRCQYFTSGRPIRDGAGRILGAVEISRDVQTIKTLAKSITEPDQISFSDILGNHPTIRATIRYAQKMAATDVIVCIRGASGTGKELFARAIHLASRRPGPFIPINCAALPEHLLESELFGYAGGAFTGARREGKPGLFEVASEGTIFLDEIGELPAGSQAKLLRVIQEKRVRRLSGSKEFPINTRIVTATNRNLEQMVMEKAFRQDLYYRINVLPLHIPPLQERVDDIPVLVEQFLLHMATRLGKPMPVLSEAAMAKLMRHGWPGNVRELKNVVERAAFLAEGDRIDVDSILFSHELGRAEPLAGTCRISGRGGPCILKDMMAEHERQIITDILHNSSSIREAAKSLGISHTALLNKLKKSKEPLETNRTTGNKSDR